MFPIEWLAHPISQLFTLTLLHFVWQGLAIVLLLVTLVELCSLRRAGDRYVCSLAALLAMTASPLATLAWLTLQPAGSALPAPHVVQFSPAGLTLAVVAPADWLAPFQPYALALWLAGVTLFGSRLLTGALGVARLRRSCLPLPPKIANIVEHLGNRLHMQALPLVFLSRQVAEAMAVGLVRPLVLIPASWAVEMPLDMLEAVIAHELAHLRRRDLWVNLLQRIVETLLFYHPAVWWLSRRLRIERELCADELAVAATGKRLEYAQTLEQIAHQRQADIRPALAAFLRGESNMRLLERVRNVLRHPSGESSRLWPAGVLALALPLTLGAAAAISSAALADDGADELKRATVKRERVERNGDDKLVTVVFTDEEDDDRTKRRRIEEREERYTKRKPGQSEDEVIERKIITKGGKPIVEVELGRGDKPTGSGDRRLEELTVLVRRLAERVEKLQDEVSQLRGEKPGVKKSFDDGDEVRKRKQELELDTKKIETAGRALEEKKRALAEILAKREGGEIKEQILKQHIEKEVAQQRRAAEDQVRAALEKAGVAREKAEAAREKAEAGRDAAREKAEATRDAIERKIRELKERDVDPNEKESILKKLRDDAASLLNPAKATIKTTKPSPEL